MSGSLGLCIVFKRCFNLRGANSGGTHSLLFLGGANRMSPATVKRVNLEESGMSVSRLLTGGAEVNLSQNIRYSGQDSNFAFLEYVRSYTS
jgi:hypothetical protein